VNNTDQKKQPTSKILPILNPNTLIITMVLSNFDDHNQFLQCVALDAEFQRNEHYLHYSVCTTTLVYFLFTSNE